MEVNEENFKTLAQYLQQTLNPDPNVRRPGEIFINFSIQWFFCMQKSPDSITNNFDSDIFCGLQDKKKECSNICKCVSFLFFSLL